MLKGGPTKRANAGKWLRNRRRKRADTKAIEKFPSVETLQEEVKVGYVAMRLLDREYGGKEEMPKKARALANSCTSGGIAFGTYAGRFMEWELADKAYIKFLLEACCLMAADCPLLLA